MKGRRRKQNCKKSHQYHCKIKVTKHFLAIVITLLITVAISITVGSGFVNAEDKVHDSSIQRKYYKSIQLKSGDTLWGIAKEYKGEYYDSIYTYIDEVMEINGLTSDEIHAGKYLTIPYYDSI